MTSTPTSTKALQRRLKAAKARQQLVSTWFTRLSLVVALGWWVLDGYGMFSSDGKPKQLAGNPMAWIGAAMAAVKLLIRWYFSRSQRDLEIQLLEADPEPKRKSSKKSKIKR
ncbi:hypothetical protein JCM1841_006111 [Sporobolomyces salmonicolor]